MKWFAWTSLVLVAIVTGACIAEPLASTRVTPTLPVAPPPPPTALPPRASPTAGSPRAPDTPGWWASDLALPKGAQLTNSTKNQAVWATADTNVDGLRDFFLREAQAAGYAGYTIVLSPGSIYDLLLVKAVNAYDINLTQGTNSTLITGTHIGIMHVVFSGAVTATLDLPLRERLNLTAGSEVAIGTAVPSPQCAACQYFLNVHIAPFKGPGGYNSQPAGTYIIDVEAIPGGTEDGDDYRWAKQCAVVVNDVNSGNFSCAGLENTNDSTKLMNVTGSWQQPP